MTNLPDVSVVKWNILDSQMFFHIINTLVFLGTIIALWLLGEKNKKAFIIFIFCNIASLCITFKSKPLVWSTVGIMVLYFVFNIVNYIKWRKQEKSK